MNIPDLMRERLADLAPQHLDIVDDSARHKGHAGATQGGHYRLTIVSASFTGKSTLARHRLVHQVLGDLMHNGIHALSIIAATPGEFQS